MGVDFESHSLERVLLAREALTPNERMSLARLVAAGQLERITPGAYTRAFVWVSHSTDERSSAVGGSPLTSAQTANVRTTAYATKHRLSTRRTPMPRTRRTLMPGPGTGARAEELLQPATLQQWPDLGSAAAEVDVGLDCILRPADAE